MIEPANGPVCIEISYEEHGLEEQHGGDPDSGNATEPRKNHLRNHRLDLEQQKSTQKNSRDIKKLFYSFSLLTFGYSQFILCNSFNFGKSQM
jgi:hypothetical protein